MESKIRDLRQEIFKFEQLSNFDKNDFFVSECNYFAFNLIKSWPNWEKKIININISGINCANPCPVIQEQLYEKL